MLEVLIGEGTVARCRRAPTVAELDALERRVRERLLALGVALSSHPVAARRRLPHGRRPLRRRPPGRRRRTLDTTTPGPVPALPRGHRGHRGTGRWRRSPSPTGPRCFLDLCARAEGWNAPGLCLVSPPGGGKTVTIGTWACRHLTLPDPPDVLLVDPMKGDYRRLVRALGGQIIRISTSPEVVINPLDLPPATILSGTGEESDAEPGAWSRPASSPA